MTNKINIIINGENREVPADFTAGQLIESLGLTGKRLAMEVNQAIVPRSTFIDHTFAANDKVEIVGAIGGG